MTQPRICIRTGNTVPAIGLGTWLTPPDITAQAVTDAIEVGYRHIDASPAYGNEPNVGAGIEAAIKRGLVKRKDLFITSKLWNTCHRPETVRTAFNKSLVNLRTHYIDNYLIHWPMGYKEGDDITPKDKNGKLLFSDVDYVDTWPAMESLVDDKVCCTIGLSNFNKRQIKRVLNVARIPPSILQIECHPYLSQRRLTDFCHAHGIVITAYSPLGSPHSPRQKPWDHPLMENPKIVEIAKHHNVSPAQILIRYQVQRGNIVVSRSITKAHMEANIRAGCIKLRELDIHDLNSLDYNERFNTASSSYGHPHHPFEYDDY